MMNRMFRVAIAFFCVSTLSAGCASSPPKRASFGGADNVTTIDADMLVGAWSARILNPIQGEEAGSSSFTFSADGTMSGTSENVAAGQTLKYAMTGSWEANGERIATKIESIEENSGNPIAALAQGLVSSFSKGRTSSLNVYEASASRLVVVEDDTGQAQEWSRVE